MLTSHRTVLGRAMCRISVCSALVCAIVTATSVRIGAQGVPAQSASTQAAAMQHDEPPQSSEQPEYPSLKITGFGDINYLSTHHPEGARGFTEGQFVLHMASALSPRATFFGEISFTPRADAGTGSPAA